MIYVNVKHPYYQTREIRATITGRQIRVVTKPGFPGWETITPASLLLAEAVAAPADTRIALFGSGHGALGVALAHRTPGAQISLLEQNSVALAMARHTLAANTVKNAACVDAITLLPEQAGAFDCITIEIPHSRQLMRHWLVEAYALLRSGGELYLAGPNDQGIQSAIEDAAQLFAGATLVRYKSRNRVARAVKQPGELPAWAQEPGIAPGTWYELELELAGQQCRLCSLPGVFAYDRLDEGTALLLSVLRVPQGARVLDIGCGYGAIGIAAALSGAAYVDLLDTNLLAVAAAQENIRRYGLAATAFPSDALAAVQGRAYDLIVTNPPFHAGKQIAYDMAEAFIADSARLLQRNGRLVLVANRFIRYDRQLADQYGSVEVLAQNSSYHVLVASEPKRTHAKTRA